jgi:[ribosomal protein S5]-alanine N-acetyltransferase
MLQIETARLAIRHLDTDDAELILELLNEESFIRNIGDRGVRNLEDARAYIVNGPITSYSQHGFGLNRVALRDAGPLIGMCGLLKRDYLEHPDIGFAFLPRYWSQGYALESAQAVLAHGRETFHLRRVLATTALDNLGSVRVLDKLGFRFDRLIDAPGYDEQSRLFVCDLA